MPRQLFEFQCTECQKIFDFNLNTSLNGNYRIHCPNCGHIHYRTVKDGKITNDRFPQNDCKILIEDIVPTKSSCRDISKEKPEHVSVKPKGFIHRLWKEKFSEALTT
jgi:DNA-directed RNA polymerase subunit RPC12/RpoP